MNTIIQRLLAETSPFFKKLQIAIVGLILAALSLKTYIPTDILGDIIKIGIAIIVLSSFTVNDATILANNGLTLQSALEIFATIPNQIADLKSAVAGTLTLDQAKTIAGIQDTPAPAAAPPVINVITNTPAATTSPNTETEGNPV